MKVSTLRRSLEFTLALAGKERLVRRPGGLFLALGFALLSSQALSAAPVTGTWTGGSATDGDWSTSGNWSGGTIPGVADNGLTINNPDTAIFGTAGSHSTVSIDAGGRNLENITFNGNTFTIGASTSSPALLLTSGGTIQTTTGASGVETFNAPLVLEGNYIFTNSINNSGVGLSFLGGITGAATSGTTVLSLTSTGSGSTSIGGIIGDGTGGGKLGISKTGAGTWTLTGANTYTGGTTASLGILAVGNDAGLGTGLLTLAGGTVTASGGARSISNNINLNTTSTIGGANAFTFSGTLTNTATAAGQTLTVSNGSTTFSGPVVTVGGTGNNKLTINAASGTTVTINGVIHNDLTDTLTGGALALTTAGTLVLNNSNTYTGGTTLSAGTLDINNASAIGTGTLAIAGATAVIDNTSGGLITQSHTNAINDTSDFGFGGTNDLDFGTGVVLLNTASAGTRTITVNGSHTLTLGAVTASSAAGSTTLTVNQGTGSGGNLVFRSYVISGNAAAGLTSTIAGNGNLTIKGVVSSTGAGDGLRMNGTGTLTLQGANTYTGATTMDAGILNAAIFAAHNVASSIGKGSSAGSAADLVFGGGTLQYTQTTGAATTDRLFTVGDANGNTATLDSSSTTAADTLSFTNTGAIAFGNTSAHTLNFTGANTGANTFNPSIGDNTGATSVTKSGSGNWVLTGANTYSGGTSVSNGNLYANGGVTGSSSGAGTGPINVTGTGAFGGSGNVRLAVGNAISVASGGTLISGGIQPTPGPLTQVAGPGMTLDNTQAGATILNLASGANLTFYLGANAAPFTNSGFDFTNPNMNSTFLKDGGSTPGIMSFASTGVTITVADLTQGNLQLSLNTPYLLIQAGANPGSTEANNDLYSGLVTTGGADGNGGFNNGWVTNLTLTTTGGIGNANNDYSGLQLYLYNGNLEVVPEPATWAMMLGGFASLVLFQRRRSFSKRS